MKIDCPFNFVNGHVIVTDQSKKYLIDTGSPISISEDGQISLLEMTFKTKNEFGGLSVEFLSEEIGIKINALIGTDILNKFDLKINPTRLVFSLSDGEFPITGNEIPLEYLMGVPIIKIENQGVKIKMFLDTGAKNSYIQKSCTNGVNSHRKEQDFYPQFGHFETEIFILPVKVGGLNLSLNFGILRYLLQTVLDLSGVLGILGTELFNHFFVILSYKRKALYLEEIQN